MSDELDSCYRALGKLEVLRSSTLEGLREWPLDRLGFHPAPGAWSAVEVLDHIVKAETGAVADLRIGLLNPHPLGTEDRPGVAVLDRALRSPQSFEVPLGAESICPDAQASLPQVIARWEETRAALSRLLREHAGDDLSCGVFCHPFANWMTFAEVLDHFYAHLYHHGFQLARLRAACSHLDSAS